MIAVIDYGMGNLRSVQKALEKCGGDAKVTSNPADLKKARKVVFPGVGAFGEAMREVRRRGLEKAIKSAIDDGKHFLGLCLGMQLLFEKSEESPGVKGLSVLKGSVRRFNFTQYPIPNTQYTLKVPHMGWNNIVVSRQSEILKGVPKSAYMYFVHSYYAAPKEKDIILTTTDYGIDFVSGIKKDNIYGFQFHPEKSQAVGLRILKNFVGLK